MYQREEDQEITPVTNLMAIAFACILAAAIAVVAMTVIHVGSSTNKAQAEAVIASGG